ncbi:MAG: hypothetical protein O3C67_09645 [Cyanobacteria bacterium]|nr:hypothetical protein [Cyanobacteriota bacterium]
MTPTAAPVLAHSVDAGMRGDRRREPLSSRGFARAGCCCWWGGNPAIAPHAALVLARP